MNPKLDLAQRALGLDHSDDSALSVVPKTFSHCLRGLV